MGTIFSSTHFSASRGVSLRWVGHSERTSTKEYPLFSTWS